MQFIEAIWELIARGNEFFHSIVVFYGHLFISCWFSFPQVPFGREWMHGFHLLSARQATSRIQRTWLFWLYRDIPRCCRRVKFKKVTIAFFDKPKSFCRKTNCSPYLTNQLPFEAFSRSESQLQVIKIIMTWRVLQVSILHDNKNH